MGKYTKDYINNLLLNKEEFKKEILNSKGFIFYMASIHNINIPEDVILDTLSKYSISYVDSLMKTKKLSVDFCNQYSEFIDKIINPVENKKSTVHLTIDDIITHLNQPEFLNLDLSNFKLSFEDLITHQDKLLPHWKKNNYNYESDNYDNLSVIINNSIHKVSIEEFKKINVDFVSKNVDIFEIVQSKHNYHFKNYAKEIVQNNITNNIEFDYEFMIFYLEFKENDETDKEIFNFLLNKLSIYDKNYSNLSNISYFTNNFSLEDWVLNYNIEDFVLMDEEKILKHKDFIRNHYAYKNKDYFRSHSLLEIERLKLDESIKNKVFDDKFWEKFVLNSNEILIELTDRDFDFDNKYLIDLNSLFINLAKNNKEILKKINMTSVFKLISTIEDNYYYSSQYDIKKFKETLYSLFENFDELLNSNIFLTYISDLKYDSIKKINFENIISSMQGKESFNYLVFLLSLNLNSNRFNAMYNTNDNIINNEINRLIPMFNFKQVKEIINHYQYSYYDYSVKSIVKSLVKSYDKKESFEKNILNYSKDDLNNLSYDNIMTLYSLSNTFKKDLLKENLDSKLITQYENRTHYSTILDNIFRGIEDTSSADYKFAKSFVNKNKEFSNTQLLRLMKANPHLTDLISIDNEEQNKYIFNNIKQSINDNLHNKKIEDIFPARNEDNYFKDLEYIFLQNKYFESSDLKDIITLQYIIKTYYPNNFQYIKEHFENSIKNASFQEIKSIMDNDNLFDILVSYNYNHRYYNEKNNLLQLNENFTDDEKYQVILKIYNSYKLSDKDKNKENNHKSISFLINQD